MSQQAKQSAAVRRKIEALSSRLSLPTVRRALGVMEGEHHSHRFNGSDEPLEARPYTPEDEARLIDWKMSARTGRPMVIERERLVTSRIHLFVDTGLEMTGMCPSGETALEVAANGLCMFASLSAKRHDQISLTFADGASITRVPFKGGLARFERTIDDGLAHATAVNRNIDALLDYIPTIGSKSSLVVIATDEHAIGERHLRAIRNIAMGHPLIMVVVSTLNPFAQYPFGSVADGGSGRRVPAFMRGGGSAEAVDRHRSYMAARLEQELRRNNATMIRASSSQGMFDAFIHLLSTTLRRAPLAPMAPDAALAFSGVDAR
ncbi:DUF58 domain-containing protein [Bifidobacterium sp. ESL0763]|uniref:DUF58 domain-containing protein n=1 Tax=Bifidobacterium sp. ESL0763 TaxID=2983227 RepID=UPI0023F75F69|nr:DUF58 domain-containing protein [Bifidobacterium sp. ESL0763]MDF7663662.1 DUF58 domain-containing protein [Bifidobacterium sp. ESL0763]